MTFRQAPSAVTICNRALSRIGHTPITSVEPPAPNNNAAQQCNIWYKPTVARLLEMHHWGLATRRASSLASVTSDRTEWSYAFIAPDDMAFPVTFSIEGSGTGLQYYRGLGGLIASRMGRNVFLLSGRTLYSQLSGPLDYVSFDIDESDFTESFAHIVELSVAASIAFPVTKNKKLEADLREQATGAMNIAIANSLNQGNHRYGDEVSERDMARGTAWHQPATSWDWWPGRV